MVLGIEFGSTRIKAVLLENDGKNIMSYSYCWTDKYENGYWTYSQEDILLGLSTCYAGLAHEYEKKFNSKITRLDAIGISAMMHGYLAFDENNNLLTPFRTWRNTNTQKAADILSDELQFNMPQRWSASHFYQCVLDKEEHIGKVKFITTLAGYVHFLLTGKKVIGIGDGSGMFPIKNGNYDRESLKKFNALLKNEDLNIDFENLLPRILIAGEQAGTLTNEGAKLLDKSGFLQAGCILCPPEGDAQTGMIATNAIRPNSGNVSAGTSAFVMAVLDKPLKNYYKEIDITATPNGLPVAMIHSNNCTSEINKWVDVFAQVIQLYNSKEVNKNKLYSDLFNVSLNSDENVGDVVVGNFYSGEPIINLDDGVPFISRNAQNLSIANLMQAHIYSAIANLNIGMKILKEENVVINQMYGHGGFFNTYEIGQKAMSCALDTSVTVFSNANEGGAYGIALLALYCLHNDVPLEVFVNNQFSRIEEHTINADENDKKKFNTYMKNYVKSIEVEKKFIEEFKKC